MSETVKVLIIGSGPAGYTAAIYAARAGLNPVLYTGGQPGGQLTTTNDVENFPGYPNGINGSEMMVDLQKQAERFGTKIHYGLVTSVDFSVYPLKVVVDEKTELLAESVIIATGATAKYLGLPTEQAYYNKGVSACAVCDGYFYRGKDVAVVGAGDSAAEEATYLAKLCTKVHLIVRRDEMRASKIMQSRVLNTPNIQRLKR
jgi:thioredoxin reductase (NADPH)